MHNIGKVIRFEVVRTLKKWTFWLAALSVPLFMALGIGLSLLMQQSSDQLDSAKAEDVKNILIKDETGYFTPNFVEQSGVSLIDDAAAGQQAVIDGASDLFIIYPSHPTEQPIQTYNLDAGIFNNSKFENTAKGLLIAAVQASLADPQAGEILLTSFTLKTETTAYKNGETVSLGSMIVPLLCVAVLFFAIMMCSNTVLVATTEEKENRITEIILTTIRSRTLIVGKICAQWILMLIQMALLTLPIVAALVFLPSVLLFDIGAIPIDPAQLAIGVVLALSGIALFTGLAFAIGAIMPTAKEANSFFAIVILLLVAPLIFLTQIMSEPTSALVQFLTYFPLTSPMVVLIRMALETLPAYVPLIAVAITVISAALVLQIAARIFQYGNLAYSKRLSLKEIISRRA